MRNAADLPPTPFVLFRRPLAAGMILACFGTLAIIAAIEPRLLVELDGSISGLLRDWRGHGVAVLATDLGSKKLALIISGVLAALLWRRCRLFAIALPSVIVVGAVAEVALKLMVGRPRPPLPEVGTALASFPSGHVLTAALLFGLLPQALFILTRDRRAFWTAVGVLFVVVPTVAWTRVLLGAHWPSDVVGSVLMAVPFLFVVELLMRRPAARRACGCLLHHEKPNPSQVLEEREGPSRHIDQVATG